MKKLLLFSAVAVLGSLSASAAIVSCGNTSFDVSTFVGSGNGCQIGDKIFSNFTNTAPVGTSVTFGSTGNSYTINFQNTPSNGFATSFSISYDIAIAFAQAPNPNYRIVSITGGMQDVTAFGNPSSASLQKTLSNGATGSFTLTDTNGTITGAPATGVGGLNATGMTVTDNFTFGSGNITNIGNTITQADTTIPEPLTLSLMGAGLLGLGLLRRRVAR